MNLLDLFSGIGGFALGARLAGYEFNTHCFSDIERYANKVYQKNFAEAVPLGDVRRVNGHELKAKYGGDWIVCGGFPCTDISDAGPGSGLRGERSGLWWQFQRVIVELQPRWVIIENVPALARRGLDRVLFSLAEAGFDAEWSTICAASTGAPHIRERLWVVAWPRTATNTKLHRCNSGEGPQHETLPDLANVNAVNTEAQGEAPWSDWQRTVAEGAICSQPLVCRDDDGLPEKLDATLSRVKACGNAIVPQVAAGIFRRLKEIEGPMVARPDHQLEYDDLFHHLRQRGYGPMLDVLPDCLSSGTQGRGQRVLVLSLAKALKISPPTALKQLRKLREELRRQSGG